jgi:hypothetical protein
MTKVQKYQTILQKMYGISGGRFDTLTADKPDAFLYEQLSAAG